MMKTKYLACAALALAGAGLQASAAGAAPKPSLDIQLTCGDEVVDVSVAGNGDWTPAHDLNSPLVGVPIAFGPFSGTFTPTVGDPVTFTDPPFEKRNVPKTRNLVIDCTYTVSGEDADGTFTGAGSVTIMVPRIHV
ncbi:MAG: hypothetical protein ABIP17_15375 [Ilumatobacteraceae bacterium]